MSADPLLDERQRLDERRSKDATQTLDDLLGSVLIGVLLKGLVLMNVSSYIQQIIIGVIIVLAVAFDQFAKSRRVA